MAVTEVSTESWFSRLGNAIKGILAGILLFGLAFPLLFWNEGRAVHRAQALDQGASAVISVQADKVLPENEGKLVHVGGMLATDDVLTDDMFGISIKGIRLERHVEMYQWQESSSTKSEKQLGGSVKKTTVYSYKKCWSSTRIDSSSFKEAGHDNPAAFPVASRTWYAENVRLGAFVFQKDMIRRIGAEEPYVFPAAYQLPAVLKGRVENDWIVIPAQPVTAVSAAVQTVTSAVQTAAAQVTTPAAPAAPAVQTPTASVMPPQIGDIRISFRQILPHNVSVVGQQIQNSFCPYPAGKSTILLVADSLQSSELMFKHAHSANNMMTWILRIVGFLMMLIGLSMIFKPLSVLADVFPVLGDLVGAGAGTVAFLISLLCWLVVVALAWVTYRPIWGIFLLVLAAAVLGFVIWRRIAKAKAGAKA